MHILPALSCCFFFSFFFYFRDVLDLQITHGRKGLHRITSTDKEGHSLKSRLAEMKCPLIESNLLVVDLSSDESLRNIGIWRLIPIPLLFSNGDILCTSIPVWFSTSVYAVVSKNEAHAIGRVDISMKDSAWHRYCLVLLIWNFRPQLILVQIGQIWSERCVACLRATSLSPMV